MPGKPDDIPQDVWDAAGMAVVHASEYTARLHEDVARAILAGGEPHKPSAKAIELADKYIAMDAIDFGLAVSALDSDYAKAVHLDVKCLARAIRKGGA